MNRDIERDVILEKIVFYQQGGKQNGTSENTGILETSAYFEEICCNVDKMNQQRENSAYRMLMSNHRIVGRAIVFVKKVIRKCLKWYVEPICVQQTEFNNASTVVAGRTTEIIMDQERKIQKLKEEIRTIENKREEELSAKKREEIRKEKEIEERYKILFRQNEKTICEMNERILCLEKEQEISNKSAASVEAYVEKLRKMGIREGGQGAETFSQAGEDAIILYVLRVLGIPTEKWNYLDLGANHAKELSNTYAFYDKGIRGVILEANPDLIPELKFYRSEDNIVNKCISTKSGEFVNFYVMSGDGLSTMDKNYVEEVCRINPSLHLEKIVPVETITVNDILNKYFIEAPIILNIDIEGMELDILSQVDFEKWRPVIIIIEMISYKTVLTINEKNKDILDFMRSKGYTEYAFTGINSLFIDERRVKNGGK